MKDKRLMSYLGRVIWMNECGFMVAKGDGTDEYFETIEEAMDYIEKGGGQAIASANTKGGIK